MGHYSGLTHVLGRFGIVSLHKYKYLYFGPISTKLVGTVRAIKKMTQNDNEPGPGWNYGETAVFTFSRKKNFWAKNAPVFLAKKTPEISEETDIYFGGNFFLCKTFSGRDQNMVSLKKGTYFFGLKSGFLAPKSNIFHSTPILVSGPFVALGKTVHFPYW